MATFLDRLLGRPAQDAKAATGAGAYNLAWHTPLSAMSRNPHRLMAEGQSLFHSNWTVHAAESAIGQRLRTTDWHLEDENGETVDDNSPEQLQAIYRLMMRPNATQTRTQLWGLTGRHLGLAGNGFWYLDQREALNDGGRGDRIRRRLVEDHFVIGRIPACEVIRENRQSAAAGVGSCPFLAELVEAQPSEMTTLYVPPARTPSTSAAMRKRLGLASAD